MGLADFLVEAGRGTSAANIGRAMGGTNQRLDSFVNQELPALVQQIQANTDPKQAPILQMKFIQSALDAGIPPKAIDQMSGSLIGQHLQGMRDEQLNQFREDLRGQPASPRPQGGPDLVKGPDVPAISGRPIDPEMAVRLGQITGANPPQMLQYLGAPADIAGKEASNQKTLTNIAADQATERAKQGLPDTPLGPGLPSLQALARISPASVAQVLPQRDKPEDPLLEERRNVLNAQAAHWAQVGAGGGAGGQGTTTESPHLVTPAMQADAGRQIAQAAKERGMTSPEQIKQIADDFGYTIEGNPTVEDNLLSAFGVSNAKLGGTYRLTPKAVTKTVTKGATAPASPAGQGRYNQDIPTGSAPASQAGGRGRGQGTAEAAQPPQPGRRQPTPEEVKAAKKRLGIP